MGFEIQGYGLNNSNSAILRAQLDAAKEKTTEEKDTQDLQAKSAVENNQDKFVKSSTASAGTYSKSQLTSTQAEMIRKSEEQRMSAFQQMLRSMVVKQGEKSNLKLFGMDLNVSQAQSDAAAASLQEGGEWSVDAVATRLMDMAKALSGGDPSKIEELRTAVQKGFKAAGVDLGGKLPGICNDTYDEVMRRFDEWAKESSVSTEE
ncbi:MAG: hypothetical protein HFG27_01215 [Provencibacterium sp.]|jgi:hypothetical protein|nr:hypothetical protein [Provencibacterium sp.]